MVSSGYSSVSPSNAGAAAPLKCLAKKASSRSQVMRHIRCGLILVASSAGLPRAHSARCFGDQGAVFCDEHAGDPIIRAHTVNVVLHDRDAGGLPCLDRCVQLLDCRLFQLKRLLWCAALRCHDVAPPALAHDVVLSATLLHPRTHVQHQPRSAVPHLAPGRSGEAAAAR